MSHTGSHTDNQGTDRFDGQNCEYCTKGTNNNERILVLSKIPEDFSLPFLSSYQCSKYPDCFAHRFGNNNVAAVKLQMTKLLGQYSSQQQGLASIWEGVCLVILDGTDMVFHVPPM